MLSSPLENLIRLLSDFPGLGPRSAKRIALYLFSWRESLMIPLASSPGDLYIEKWLRRVEREQTEKNILALSLISL